MKMSKSLIHSESGTPKHMSHRVSLIKSCIFAASMIACGMTSTAYAGGLFVPLGGVANTGRAAAAVVSTRDPNAIAYNPALIALGDGHQLLVDVTWGMLQFEFQRAPWVEENGTVTTFDKVENQAKGVAIPQVLFTTDFGTDCIGLGVGVFPPNAAPVSFPLDGAQRYAIVNMANTIAFTTEIAFAWRPLEWLSIGAGFQNVTFVFKGTGISSTYFGVLSQPEDPDMDSVISVDATDYFTPSANFGIWARPVEGFEIGLAFQLFADLKSEGGKFKTALPNHYVFERSQVRGKGMDMAFSLPWTLKLGLRYEYNNLFDIEMDAWYSRWSRQKELKLYSHDVYLYSNALVDDVHVDDYVVPREMKDTFGISIGSDVHVLPELTVRGGFLYESGAAKDELYSAFLYDNHKLGPTVGLSYHINHIVRLDFAFAHIHQLPKTVKNGTFKQYNFVYPEMAHATNNGDYKSFYDFIGIGANFTFGGEKDE